MKDFDFEDLGPKMWLPGAAIAAFAGYNYAGLGGAALAIVPGAILGWFLGMVLVALIQGIFETLFSEEVLLILFFSGIAAAIAYFAYLFWDVRF